MLKSTDFLLYSPFSLNLALIQLIPCLAEIKNNKTTRQQSSITGKHSTTKKTLLHLARFTRYLLFEFESVLIGGFYFLKV